MSPMKEGEVFCMNFKIIAVGLIALLLFGIGYAGFVKADSDDGNNERDGGKDNSKFEFKDGNGNSGKDKDDDEKQKGLSKLTKINKEIEKDYKFLGKIEKKLWIKNRLQQEINKMNGLVSRLEALSLKLKEKGFDTAAFDLDIASIKAKLIQASAMDENQIKEGLKLLKDALKIFKEEIKTDLRDIIREQEIQKKAIVKGNGTIGANVTGQVEFEGSGTLVIISQNGDLRIKGGNVSVEGNGTKLSVDDGFIKYRNFAKITITGSNFKFKASGRGVEFTGSGSGKFEMEGNGNYHFGSLPQVNFNGKTYIYWNIPIPTITPSVIPTPTVNATPTPNATATPTVNAIPTPNATITPTPTVNATPTPSVNSTATPTPSVNATVSPTPTISPIPSVNATISPTPTVNATATPTISPSPSISPTPTISPTPSVNATISPTPTVLANGTNSS